MSRAHEIYPLERFLKIELDRVSRDRNNADILTRYYKVRSTQVALATLLEIVKRLRHLSELLNKRFEDATIGDLEDLNFKINQRWKHPSTRNKYRKYLKKLYQWLDGYADGEFPQRVKWIKLEKVPLVAITEDDLIPFNDAVRICECADNLRDKALFTCKLDAGCRIGEILTVRLSEVKITDNGAVLESDGKTGRAPLILTWSTSYLVQWLNNHPFKDKPQVPLFIDSTKAEPTQLSYAAARKAFKRCVARAGIKKRVWLHLFKHVSSSEDANNGMPDSFRRYKHHWTESSRMPQVYEHLNRSIIPKIQQEGWRSMGLDNRVAREKSKEVEPKKLLVKSCARCKFENPSDSAYCNRCGFIVDASNASKAAIANEMANSLLNKLTEDPKKLEKLLALIEG